ncbi:MAG: peptide deformylase [Bacilli bacterium]|nr:peptide deformylase [Bacilli bacterium]MDD3305028.1 peptide deformylase [Bacilli bacterium]MDD4053641.1 peptide deformylase [Bacilli bacterium]MDD4411140.1 peptide deformylase [Bacilli bacterium]
MTNLIKILDEKDKRLRKISSDIVFPLSNEDKNLINEMLEHLVNSQIEEIAKEYNLRPGMGLAAIQLGIAKKYFVIAHEQEDKSFNRYTIINPKIISHSEELIYAGGGEGCLSVNRDVEGIIPRYARITIEYRDINGNTQQLRAREELAIAVQHELDHLNGILFIDKIDKDNPFKDEEKMRMI